jgi:hypothetical protein
MEDGKMKMKTRTTILALAIMAGLAMQTQAATYYSQGTKYVASGSNWNTARDGTGSVGFSSTYRSAANDIVMQTNLLFYYNASTAPLDDFNANSYTMESNVTMRARDATATNYASFNNGDITVDAGQTLTILNATTVGAGNSAGGITGSADLILASGTTLVLDQAASGSSGDFEFGLNVVGSGLIDLDYANADCNWLFTGLSSEFAGEIRGDTFNGYMELAAGDGAAGATVKLGRSAGDRTGKLNVTNTFSVGELLIDGETVSNGIYTVTDLVATNAGYADNLIDNGGTVYVGQTIFVPKVTYYSQTGSLYPTSGAAWNQERSGADTNLNGYSTTYAYTNNNIVIQDGQTFYYNSATAAYDDWNAYSYTVEGDVTLKQRNNTTATNYATFNNGDITVDGGGILRVLNAHSASTNEIVGGILGSAKLNLASGTILNLDSSSSSSSGGLEFGLDIVGDGTIDFEYANATTWFYLSGLSSNFTGLVRGDRFNGEVRFAAGNGAINADVQIGRSEQNKTCKLNLDTHFSAGTLKIDGVTLNNGIYTYADLVAYGSTNAADFSDNLIDNGGTVYVGQALPDGPLESPTITSSISGNDLTLSWDDGYAYNVLTNINLLNESGWGTAASGAASPVNITIGSDAAVFYKLEYE